MDDPMEVDGAVPNQNQSNIKPQAKDFDALEDDLLGEMEKEKQKGP